VRSFETSASSSLGDRLAQRDEVIAGAVAHEALELAIDQLFEPQVDRPVHMAAEAHRAVFLAETDARTPRTQ
jgi:hypothetical protein